MKNLTINGKRPTCRRTSYLCYFLNTDCSSQTVNIKWSISNACRSIPHIGISLGIQSWSPKRRGAKYKHTTKSSPLHKNNGPYFLKFNFQNPFCDFSLFTQCCLSAVIFTFWHWNITIWTWKESGLDLSMSFTVIQTASQLIETDTSCPKCGHF